MHLISGNNRILHVMVRVTLLSPLSKERLELSSVTEI